MNDTSRDNQKNSKSEILVTVFAVVVILLVLPQIVRLVVSKAEVVLVNTSVRAGVLALEARPKDDKALDKVDVEKDGGDKFDDKSGEKSGDK
jgi:hypothetical protein